MAGKGDKAELEQLLSSYIDGECPQAERDRVQEALQHDPEFRALYTQLLRTIETVGAMPSEAAPRHVRERILSKLERRALLGVTSVAAAPPVRQEPSRSRPTAWLGLVAAAMLVAGVGATWWIRMHQEKASSQLAMAPVPPHREGRIIVGETAPLEASERTRGSAGPDRATDEAGRQHGTKAPQPVQAPLSPPQVVPPAVVQPESPVMADRAVHEITRGESPARPVLDRAPAMRERDGAPVAGKPEASRPLGRAAAETTAAPIAEAPPLPEAKNVHLATGGAGDASRLAGDGGGSRQAAPAVALAAAPPGKDASDLPVKEAAPEAAMLASAGKGQAVLAPTTGVPLSAVARAAPAMYAGAHSAGGQLQEAPGPAVTQLQVSVRDVGHQLAFTGGVIRDWVRQEGGQTTQLSDASMFVAAVPSHSKGLLTEWIKKAPGVLQVQSRELSASDPLVRQVSSLAAELEWRIEARDFVTWSASGHETTTTSYRFSPDYHVFFHNVPQAPRIVPRDYVPLVIVLQPVRPATPEPVNP